MCRDKRQCDHDLAAPGAIEDCLNAPAIEVLGQAA
jgi:hypothetical protein